MCDGKENLHIFLQYVKKKFIIILCKFEQGNFLLLYSEIFLNFVEVGLNSLIFFKKLLKKKINLLKFQKC